MKERNPKGAGRKPLSKKYSDALKTDVFKALQNKAKTTGQTFGDVIAELAFDGNTKDYGTRAVALKMIQEILVIRETQSKSEIDVKKYEGPAIMLPAVKPVPPPPAKDKDKEGVALH